MDVYRASATITMNQTIQIGPLFTDLYELTMAASYFDHHVTGTATFSLYIRETDKRSYFVAAGLEDVLNMLHKFHFSEDDLGYLRTTGLFSDAFLSFLADLGFSGDVFAMPEGTIFFSDEPVLEVTAPIIEAQLLETFLLNTIGFQTLIATKAARCLHAARGRPLIDFSLRRTQGWDAGIKVARSSYIAGFEATSNVIAGKIYGIPISGTMAHSFVSVFGDEAEAFTAFYDTFPENAVFLVDTYDTIEGVRNAIKVADNMRKKGHCLKGIRLDSGDMVELSREARKILDCAGFPETKIFASSGFDEFKISDAIERGGKIDAFGVGTKLGVSADAPFLDIVYKLVRFEDRDVRKLSPGKITLAGKKQVFRKTDRQERFIEDIIGSREEIPGDAIPLMKKAMENGALVDPIPSLQEIRNRFGHHFSLLDEKYKNIYKPARYPVAISPRLLEHQPEFPGSIKHPEKRSLP